MNDKLRQIFHSTCHELEDAIDDAYSDGYEKGLNDAWECIRKIVGLGEPIEVVEPVGLRNFICKYSASEAMQKLKKYESDHIDCTKFSKQCDVFDLLEESREPKFILYICPNCSKKWRVIPGLLDNEICPNCGYKVSC